jgi:hypothetical protein
MVVGVLKGLRKLAEEQFNFVGPTGHNRIHLV